mgnify:CR=1 FL=1
MKEIDLANYTYFFWDFDGVIKESVSIKTNAFKKLFSDQNNSTLLKIIDHHLENGGVSRYEKIPLYLEWSNKEKSADLTSVYLENFSNLVVQAVIDSDWVEGVKNYIDSNYQSKVFFLVTGTPQKEIEIILQELKIKHYFKKIVGSPTKKDEAVKTIINKDKLNLAKAIFIGDSNSDYKAAKSNEIQFLLRTHPWNVTLSRSIKCHQINDFLKI